MARLPALGGLVTGGGVALEVSGLYGRHVLGEAEVAKTGKLAVLAQEDVLGLGVVGVKAGAVDPRPSPARNNKGVRNRGDWV